MKVEEFNEIKYYVGRSAKENWKLLDDSKKINKDYIWFHLNSFASPYVIMYATIDELERQKDISNNVTNISVDRYLQFGAELCKEYSKYKFMKKLKIMYVPVKKLTKTGNIGEVDIKGKTKLIAV